jgi:uncharacterized membrane protein YfcA
MKIRLFLIGYLQISLLSLQTKNLVSGNILMIMITSYLISLSWSYNVCRVSRGNIYDIQVYCLGCMLGSITGYFIGILING